MKWSSYQKANTERELPNKTIISWKEAASHGDQDSPFPPTLSLFSLLVFPIGQIEFRDEKSPLRFCIQVQISISGRKQNGE